MKYLIFILLSGCSTLDCSIYPNIKEGDVEAAINDPLYRVTLVSSCKF